LSAICRKSRLSNDSQEKVKNKKDNTLFAVRVNRLYPYLLNFFDRQSNLSDMRFIRLGSEVSNNSK